MKRLALLLAVSPLLACGKNAASSAPWLTMPDPATHSTRYFPVNPGDPHGAKAGQPIDCNGCHAERPSAAVTPGTGEPFPAAPSFKTFTCTGCHVEVQPGVFHDDIGQLVTLTDHAGRPEFDPAQPLAFDQACLGCHRDGTGSTPPPYHGQLFPIDATSKHAGIACSSCHGATRDSLTDMKCASCHTDPARSPSFATQHAPVAGIAILVELTPPPASCTPVALPAPQSPGCLLCHAGSHVDHVELSHPTGNTAFGNDTHKGAGCFTCHVATMQVSATVTPPAVAPSGYTATDFNQPAQASQSSQGCATCHSFGCGNGN